MIMKDGTLKYTPKNAESRTKVTFSSMKLPIRSTNTRTAGNVRLLKTSNNQRVNKKNISRIKKNGKKKEPTDVTLKAPS